jgi:hypothetical protein
MSLKIEVNNSATAYHIVEGAVLFPYAVDARHAVSQHPKEWKATPWSADEMAEARRAAGEPEVELSPEDQAALDEHQRAVDEANERLAKFRADQEEKRILADQVAQDEAIVNSAPPTPTFKRPFGRPGEPTPAELEQIKKREAKKADDERIAREKATADAQANSGAKITQ